MNPVSFRDRCHGCLTGLAVGDALGTAVEFCAPGTFKPVEEITGGGPFQLEPGEWTDDTSMALCLASSLSECRGFDAADQMRRYVRWWKEGYLSSNGRCFDIGITVRSALQRFLDTLEPFSGSADTWSAGNGSLMRLAPVPMYFAADPAEAIRLAGESSRTTHGTRTAIDACRYFSGLLLGALAGEGKDTILASLYSPVPGLWEDAPLDPEIMEVAAGSFLRKEPPEIQGTGYVVRSLEAALWAFSRGKNFRDGALLAVNLGDDADTTGAIYGQLAGAFYGVKAIPRQWREILACKEIITSIAQALSSLHGN
jgi:ADP-ribosylglycohydrolase